MKKNIAQPTPKVYTEKPSGKKTVDIPNCKVMPPQEIAVKIEYPQKPKKSKA